MQAQVRASNLAKQNWARQVQRITSLNNAKTKRVLAKEEALFFFTEFDPFAAIAVGGEGRGSCMSENGAPIIVGEVLVGIVIKTLLCNKVRKKTYVLFSNLAQMFDGWSPKMKSIIV